MPTTPPYLAPPVTVEHYGGGASLERVLLPWDYPTPSTAISPAELAVFQAFISAHKRWLASIRGPKKSAEEARQAFVVARRRWAQVLRTRALPLFRGPPTTRAISPVTRTRPDAFCGSDDDITSGMENRNEKAPQAVQVAAETASRCAEPERFATPLVDGPGAPTPRATGAPLGAWRPERDS
jgi:hypothetical protein